MKDERASPVEIAARIAERRKPQCGSESELQIRQQWLREMQALRRLALVLGILR